MAKESKRLLTTTEAGQLVGRSPAAIRRAAHAGALVYAGFNEQRRPLLDKDAVLSWAAAHPGKPSPPRQRWLTTLDALDLLGPATSVEVATYLGLHPGNVRKHLKILTSTNDVVRLDTGQWATSRSVADRRIAKDATGEWFLLSDEDLDPTQVVTAGAA
ncbi:MAG: helix-turn-helix domain-containing protein [Acidimicrobiales bacterium]